MNSQSSDSGFLVADHVVSDALVPALIGLADVGYHQISTVDEGDSANKINVRLIVSAESRAIPANNETLAVACPSTPPTLVPLPPPPHPLGPIVRIPRIYTANCN